MKFIKRHYAIIFLIIFGCSSDKGINKVELTELSGAAIDLSQYKGKVVFINFWATWCKPCIQEMPTIVQAQAELKADEVVFLFASNEEPAQIEKFAKRHDYNFHYVHLENMETLNIQALPTTFIFNREGELKFSETGFRVWNDQVNVDLITKIINDHEQ